MFLIIDLYSNNLKSLKDFKSYLYTNEVGKKLKIFTRFYAKKTKKKRLTILKSPHVNKRAQEQFNLCVYKTRIIVFSPNFFLLLFYIKTIKSNLFSDIRITVKTYSNNTLLSNKLINCINPKKYKFEDFSCNEVKSYLKILESFGEFSFFIKNYS